MLYFLVSRKYNHKKISDHLKTLAFILGNTDTLRLRQAFSTLRIQCYGISMVCLFESFITVNPWFLEIAKANIKSKENKPDNS